MNELNETPERGIRRRHAKLRARFGRSAPGAGEGETELNRLFYRLGWTKGWYKGKLRNKVFGQLAGETAPDMKAIKTKLLELARKYDAA